MRISGSHQDGHNSRDCLARRTVVQRKLLPSHLHLLSCLLYKCQRHQCQQCRQNLHHKQGATRSCLSIHNQVSAYSFSPTRPSGPHLSVDRVCIFAWTKSAFRCGSVNHSTSPKLYWSYYPHRSREFVSPVCGTFMVQLQMAMLARAKQYLFSESFCTYYEGMQECRNVGIQECRNVKMQECRNGEIQEWRNL